MRLGISLPDDLVRRVDGVRGDVPRSAWIRRTIEDSLERAKRLAWAKEQARRFELPDIVPFHPDPEASPGKNEEGSGEHYANEAKKFYKEGQGPVSRSEAFRKATQDSTKA